ncbi:MAG: hypothetical protein WC441_04470 [Patescibacteria group bacterium]
MDTTLEKPKTAEDSKEVMTSADEVVREAERIASGAPAQEAIAQQHANVLKDIESLGKPEAPTSNKEVVGSLFAKMNEDLVSKSEELASLQKTNRKSFFGKILNLGAPIDQKEIHLEKTVNSLKADNKMVETLKSQNVSEVAAIKLMDDVGSPEHRMMAKNVIDFVKNKYADLGPDKVREIAKQFAEEYDSINTQGADFDSIKKQIQKEFDKKKQWQNTQNVA